MIRFLTLLLLLAPAPFLLPAASGQRYDFRPPPFVADALSGDYVNSTNGARCQVYRRGGEYVFVNENGDEATFAWAGRDRLGMVATWTWDPNVVVTVGRDRFGRTLLRFDSGNARPGMWVSAR